MPHQVLVFRGDVDMKSKGLEPATLKRAWSELRLAVEECRALLERTEDMLRRRQQGYVSWDGERLEPPVSTGEGELKRDR